MKALTIWQPWASLIARGLKTIETRRHTHWGFLAGRRIAIHAGARWDEYALGEMERVARAHGLASPPGGWDALAHASRAEAGCIVATAYVADHRRLTAADEPAALCRCDGLWGFAFDDIRPVEPPVPIRGHQGVWGVPPVVLDGGRA